MKAYIINIGDELLEGRVNVIKEDKGVNNCCSALGVLFQMHILCPRFISAKDGIVVFHVESVNKPTPN